MMENLDQMYFQLQLLRLLLSDETISVRLLDDDCGLAFVNYVSAPAVSSGW